MPSSVDAANEIHAELLKAIAPVTPGTIRASSLSPRRNLALFGIACCSALSFAIFVVPIIIWTDNASNHKALTELFQIVGAAGMGSGFYALYTASGYINSTTFDRRYSSTYVVRFALGILAGIILGYFLKELLHLGNSGNGSTGPTVTGVAVSALALVGGFASDAVARILFRISETLVALVSGSDKEKVDAAKQKAVADAEKKNAQAMGDIVKDLQTAVTAPPADMAAKVQEVIAKTVARR